MVDNITCHRAPGKTDPRSCQCPCPRQVDFGGSVAAPVTARKRGPMMMGTVPSWPAIHCQRSKATVRRTNLFAIKRSGVMIRALLFFTCFNRLTRLSEGILSANPGRTQETFNGLVSQGARQLVLLLRANGPKTKLANILLGRAPTPLSTSLEQG